MPMYGLSADWVLALEASATGATVAISGCSERDLRSPAPLPAPPSGRGSVAFASDVLALTPPARLQQLRSAVQARATRP